MEDERDELEREEDFPGETSKKKKGEPMGSPFPHDIEDGADDPEVDDGVGDDIEDGDESLERLRDLEEDEDEMDDYGDGDDRYEI